MVPLPAVVVYSCQGPRWREERGRLAETQSLSAMTGIFERGLPLDEPSLLESLGHLSYWQFPVCVCVCVRVIHEFTIRTYVIGDTVLFQYLVTVVQFVLKRVNVSLKFGSVERSIKQIT